MVKDKGNYENFNHIENNKNKLNLKKSKNASKKFECCELKLQALAFEFEHGDKDAKPFPLHASRGFKSLHNQANGNRSKQRLRQNLERQKAKFFKHSHIQLL